MTKERFIVYDGMIDFTSLHKQIFKDINAADEHTDKSAPIKLVDNNDVLSLIEALTIDFSEKDGKKCEKNCLIKRFEVEERLINTYVRTNVSKSFVDSVKFAMFRCGESGFDCRNTHLWAQNYIEKLCYLAQILELDTIIDIDEFKTHKRDLPKRNKQTLVCLLIYWALTHYNC